MKFRRDDYKRCEGEASIHDPEAGVDTPNSRILDAGKHR
jgi:hypothetical protein